MPARDNIHHLIKAAIVNDGWQITADPYVISYGERFLFVDLAAIQSSGVIGAERESMSSFIRLLILGRVSPKNVAASACIHCCDRINLHKL